MKNGRPLKIPSKIFLLGEYSVLQGGDALLYACEPFLEFTIQTDHPAPLASWHEESPVAHYQREFQQSQPFKLLEQRLGLGTSTAELIASYVNHRGELAAIEPLFQWYRLRFPKHSGVDLLVQFLATREGTGAYLVKHAQASKLSFIEILQKRFDVSFYKVPSQQKLATHEALAQSLPQIPVQLCNQLIERLLNFDLSAILEFTKILGGMGLETEYSAHVRRSFSVLPHVLAVKGCGAGLNDVYFVISEKGKASEQNSVQEEFQLCKI